MRPAMVAGDTVLVSRPSLHPPRWGDVVLVRQPDGLRLHRLVWGPPLAPASGFWRTKADRARGFDARIRSGDVLGTVVAVEPGTYLLTARLIAAARSLSGALFSRLRQLLRFR